ncbi:MAG: hypothetical protein HY852_23980 [Bradyrhizobium sp.]|uniref:hypothetical protein n=1 Tax=Bradyrhizobium sp. TaxID=376 RepID=UPI0025C72931|nr:hypothetical protein [Bradyrhizobium sp.]MBI5264866.1 hypothetical protein [Bradyrhizobium sp.]
MHKSAFKALFTFFILGRAERARLDWERRVLVFSTAVTIGLVALYVFGKVTSRW